MFARSGTFEICILGKITGIYCRLLVQKFSTRKPGSSVLVSELRGKEMVVPNQLALGKNLSLGKQKNGMTAICKGEQVLVCSSEKPLSLGYLI